MAKAGNRYADKIFSEHPIALWPLDEQAYYISQIDDNDRLFSNWTLTGGTANNSPTYYQSPPPLGNAISSVVKSTTATGTVEALSPELFSPPTISTDISTFNINLFLYLKPSYINWFAIGYRYNDSGGTPQEIISDQIPPPSSEGWVNYNATYPIPTSWSTGVKMFIQINFKDSASGTVDDRSFIMNGFSIGQGAETTCFESLGVNAVSLPAELELSSYGFTGYPVDQYGLSAENGYYLVRNNSLLARNDGFPIIYGTDHSTKLYPTLYGYPSLVFPGKGMLHEEGRNKYYSLEMWAKIDPLTTTAQKILGPLDSNDGIYVKEGFITLVIGDEIGSYCVGEWYRPMLLHVILKESNATMMINGEEVVSIPFNRETVSLSSGRDWWGAYTYDTVSAYYLDTISIFPYIVSNAVAKRRFVYGQGTPSAESIDTAYYGTPTQIDFPVSEYNNNVIYPDIARWDAGYFNNLIATKDYISTPNYSLPVINIGGRDLQEWYDNNNIVNNSEYPDGQHPKFITFRPNQVTRTNLVPNPSFEVSTSGWTSMGGSPTRVTSDSVFGSACLQMSYGGAGTTAGIQTNSAVYIPVVAGEIYRYSAYVKRSVNTGTVAMNIMWINDLNQLVQDGSHLTIAPTNTWTRYSLSQVAPVGATKAYVRVYQSSGEGGGSTATTIYVDGIMLEKSTTLNPYFDAYYADSSYKAINTAWNGVEEQSSSSVYFWDPDGINYTAPSYLNFPSLNVLNDQVSAVYGIFEAEKDIATDRTLISFVNIVNGSEFSITINSDEVSYSIKKAQDTSPTQLFSEVITLGTETLVGVQFDELGLNFGYDVSQFFSSPSSIQVFVGGNGVNTFEGKIYVVGFSNANNFSMISSHFYTSADITEATPQGAIERLAQGIVRSSDYGSMLNHLASYTLVPEYEYGHLFLDISVQSEWEEYFPLSYFASYVKDENGNLVYDLDMLQMNIGYTSIISTDVWSYYEIVETYATYAALNAGFSTYLNLQKNNTSGDTIDVSQSAIQSYITFQSLESGANSPISEFTYGAGVDANVLVIDADAVNTLAVPDKAYDTVFAFRDGTVVFPPKSRPFEDYAMVVHLYINQRSILKNPLKIRRFEITSKNFNYNTVDYAPENKTQLGTRFGKKIYPQSDVYGGIIDSKWKNPYTIYKYSTPYIFTTKNSGIKPSRETYTSVSYPTANEILLPVNESGAFVYKIAALQMMVKPQFKEENASVKFMEIRHRDGTLTFIADKIGDRAQISVYSRSEALLLDGGSPSTTEPTYFSNYDGGLTDSSYTQYFNMLNGPYPILGVSTDEYTPVTGTEFYNNGRYVGTLTLVNNEWSAVGISLPFELNFDEYEFGGITLYGGFVFNNISYYQSDGLGIESTILGRTWDGIVNDQGVTGTPPNIWQYWTGDKWEYAYVLGTDIDFSSTPEDIFDAYMGTNSLIVDDGLKISMKQKEVAVITDATWSMFSQKPA